jgi:SAM-dependent methyltransferase
LGKEERHALGAHFTYEADIQKIVRPTIVRPWEERIAAGKNVADLLELLRQLRAFRVLDPACGSGNFLFVAYRALRELEQNLLLKLFGQDKRQFEKVGTASGISPKQFFGLDVNDNAVETAKVTLMLARRLATRSAHEFWDAHADVLPGGDTHALQFEKDLPLDNLDANMFAPTRFSRRGQKWTPSSVIRRFSARVIWRKNTATIMHGKCMPRFPTCQRWPTFALIGFASLTNI